ncbi:ferredoxin [Actinophytocola sediminis]
MGARKTAASKTAASKGKARGRNHVSVNNDRCRRYGICVAEAPTLFRMTTDGGLRYLRTVPDEQVEQAKAAVRSCPMLAIELTERR